MKVSDAFKIASWVQQELKPACERIEIVGSIRRRKDEVHDMELLAIPRSDKVAPEFGNKASMQDRTLLDRQLRFMLEDRTFVCIKDGDKYKQFQFKRCADFGLLEPINPFCLDLFICTPPAEWGVLKVIRTGPNSLQNSFSRWMVTPKHKGGALPDGYRVQAGAVWEGETQKSTKVALPLHSEYSMPNEEDFFKFCGLPYIEPAVRWARWGG